MSHPILTMELSYQEDSKSSSEETDPSSEHNNDHDVGTGRTYECVFCKRGFTTAQALGGHMNIHRKDRANNNKAKPINFPPSSSSKVIDDDDNYANLGCYSSIPSHLARRGNHYHSTTIPDHEVDNNTNNNYYHPIYFPPQHSYYGTTPSSHVVHYNSEVLCVENQRERGHLFGQDWRERGVSLYTNNPLCVHENNEKIKDNNEEDGLDLELRLGHHP